VAWIVLATSLLYLQPAAQAAAKPRNATVQGCHLIACITVYTGSKNYGNHTQWVSGIEVTSLGGNGHLEAWTQNFYNQSWGTGDVYYAINRWVATGNYVCGAVTVPGVDRRIACIGISV
jgi:hypothetical protein